MRIARRIVKKAGALGTGGVTYIRKQNWNDLTRCLKRHPAQALVGMTVAGFMLGFLSARR